MSASEGRQLILKTLKEKSCMKQDVFAKTKKQFNIFKDCLDKLSDEMSREVSKVDERIEIKYRDRGPYAAEIQFAGDTLIFMMHTNVFDFDKSHHIWQSSSVKEDQLRAFCGMINIYNFLSDSFKYNRVNDSGYLVARMFLNKDLHFFVEGKRQLGFLYNDFTSSVLDRKTIESVIESAILYTLDFDLRTPPYNHVSQTSVHAFQQIETESRMRTGKRMGYRFQADDDIIM